MESTRCFIAISFPDEVVKEIARLQEMISKKGFTGKLTELNNLHLTLKFLGDIDEKKVALVKEHLGKVSFDKIELHLGEVGTFAYSGNPRIIWLKLEGQALWDLQAKIDEVLNKCGFPKEERFMAHVTLARIKYVEDKKRFREFIKEIKPEKISFQVESFALKESELKTIGPVYRDIETYKVSLKSP